MSESLLESGMRDGILRVLVCRDLVYWCPGSAWEPTVHQALPVGFQAFCQPVEAEPREQCVPRQSPEPGNEVDRSV